jgi:hypothetical protein
VEDNSYDFSYQQSRILPHEVAVLPGDELVTDCVYQTPTRTEPTFVSIAAFMSANTSFSVAINIRLYNVSQHVAYCSVMKSLTMRMEAVHPLKIIKSYGAAFQILHSL